MPKALPAVVIVVAALGAAAALFLLGDGTPDEVGLGTGLGATGPSSTALTTTDDGEPVPLQPAVVAPTSATASTTSRNGTSEAPPAQPAGANAVHTHEIARNHRVRGIVRAPGGAPAAGVRVVLRIQGTGAHKVLPGRTDAEGRFDLLAPISGKASLVVQGAGMANVAVPVTSDDPIEVEPPPAVTIAGIVRDGEGEPVAGAFVNSTELGVAIPTHGVATTDGNGAFTMLALRRGGRYELTATHSKLAPSAPLEVEAPAVDATLTLFEGATLVVKVFGADGGVLSSGSMTSAQSGSLQSFAEIHGPGGSRTLANWNVADPEQFEVTGLVAGEYRVVVQARGHGRVERSGIAVPRGGTIDAEVRLTRGGYVLVTVVDEHGAKLISATATDSAEAGKPFGMLVQGVTGSDGVARVGPLPAGAARILVNRAGYRLGFADVDVQEGLELTARVTLKRH